MKLYINKNLLLAFLAVVMFSCKENEDPLTFAQANNIKFTDHPTYSATFTTLDDVILNVEVDGDVTSLDVTGTKTTTVDEKKKVEIIDLGTVAITSGKGTFSKTLVELNDLTSKTFSFTDGESKRLFDWKVEDPITFIKITPKTDKTPEIIHTSSTVNQDSTFRIVFEVNTKNATIASHNLFLKKGKTSDYGTTVAATNTNNTTVFKDNKDTKLKDSVRLVSAKATYAIGDEIYYKVEAISGSLIGTDAGYITVVGVPLTKKGTVALRTPEYVISTGVLDSLNNAYNFSALKKISDKTLLTSSDSADVKLVVNSGNLDLVAGTSGTTFLVADETFKFSGATYESVRDKMAAGTPAATVSNIENHPTGAVILISIGIIPQAGWPAADNRKYAAIQITNINKTSAGVTSEVTFDYMASSQPK